LYLASVAAASIARYSSTPTFRAGAPMLASIVHETSLRQLQDLEQEAV
jgi:hypothetical protein